MSAAASVYVVLIDFVVGGLPLFVSQFADFVVQAFLAFLENGDFAVEFFYFHFEVVDATDSVDEFNLLRVQSGFEFSDVDFVLGNLVVSSFNFFFHKNHFFLQFPELVFQRNDFLRHALQFSNLKFDSGHFLVFGLDVFPER